MRLPLTWLNEFVDSAEYSAEQIGDILTNVGLELEDIDLTPLAFEGVIVARVVEKAPHPDADSLCVAQVNTGKETLQVVCGAPNCREGLVTAFAPVGAKLFEADGKVFKIKKGKLRGVESYGMLCSGKELGLDQDADGIMELDPQTPLGQPLAELYQETVLDIALTPNLSHCFAVRGIAREFAAAEEKFFKAPSPVELKETGAPIESEVSVKVEDFERCPRYACRMLRGVKVGPSPDWLKRRLEACGVRSLNNVVDVTNMVMLESGQPLHAFDFAKLRGGKLRIRTAADGETFTTLDDVERRLNSETLMICDGEGSIAIAGVMGGANSEVSEDSVDIVLESAYFQPTTVRRSSKSLQLSTEASKRFERGCDPNGVIEALDQATALIHTLAGGSISKGVIDEKQGLFPRQSIRCRVDRVNAILGTQLALSEVERIFNSLGLEFTLGDDEVFTVLPPTYRVDLNREIDLIEEVGRIYGYDNIAAQDLNIRFPSSSHLDAPAYTFERAVRQRCHAEGLQELMTCDLISPSLSQLPGIAAKPEQLLAVSNPTSIEQSVLRPSLMPGLLQVVKYNLDHYSRQCSGYEVGRIHQRTDGQLKEQSACCILMTGKQRPEHWDTKPTDVDFYDLKGTVENVLNAFAQVPARFEVGQSAFFHPGRQAEIFIQDALVGYMGEVHPAVLKDLDIDQAVYFAEIHLHDLYPHVQTERYMTDLPQFPGSERDWTLTLKEAAPAQAVFDALAEIPSKLLKESRLLDVYRSEKLGPDRKNLTFRFTYRSDKKTLSQEAVDREHQRIEKQTEEKLAEWVLA